MILPSKHIRLHECILGVGAVVLELLSKPMDIDEIREAIDASARKGKIPARPSFENIILAINILYAMGAISADADGNIVTAKNEKHVHIK